MKRDSLNQWFVVRRSQSPGTSCIVSLVPRCRTETSMNRLRQAFLIAVCAAVVAHAQPAQKQVPVPYKWKSVQIVGAGFVDGIVFHPTAKDVRYARTDI